MYIIRNVVLSHTALGISYHATGAEKYIRLLIVRI